MKTPLTELSDTLQTMKEMPENKDAIPYFTAIQVQIKMFWLEKEKQMIIDAYIKGQVKYAKTGVYGQTGEQYYNENFKQ